MTDDTTELFPAQFLEVEDSAGAVAALATVAAKGVPLTRGTPRAFLVPDGYQVQVEDLPHPPDPRRITGSVELTRPDSLIDYIGDHNDAGRARLYASLDRLAIVAVLNDDAGSLPDWRDHRATLTLTKTPEWIAWTGASDRLGDQGTFSEFLEQHAHDIVTPDAATMIDVARTFQATTDVNFRTAVRPESGTVQVQYDETIEGKAGRGAIDVPDSFVVRCAPFYGAEPVDLTARLRYRINGGQLAIGYSLLHADLRLREAFDEIADHVADETGITVRHGTPPAAREDDGLR